VKPNNKIQTNRRFILPKFLLHLFLGFFLPHISVAQQANNLEFDIKNYKTQDSILVNKYLQLSLIYLELDIDKSKANAEKALYISKKLSFSNGIAKSYTKLGKYYKLKAQKQKALLYLDSAFLIYEKTGNDNGKAHIYNNKAVLYSDLNRFNKAVGYFNIAYEIGTTIHKADARRGLANIHFVRSNFTKAIEFWLEAESLYKKANKPEKAANCYQSIGKIYYLQNDPKTALGFYQQSLNTSNNLTKISNLNVMGSCYRKMKLNDSALIMYSKALQLSQNTGIEELLTTLNCNIAGIYSDEGKYEKAEFILDSIYESTIKSGSDYEIAEYFNSYAYNSFYKKNFSKTLVLLDSSEVYALKCGNIELLSAIYIERATVYSRNGESNKVFKALMKHTQLKDSVFSISKTELQENLIFKYETELKDQEIKTLKTENEYKNKLNIYLIISIAFVFLLGASLILIYFMQAKYTKQKLLIANQNKEKQQYKLQQHKVENEKLHIEIESKYRELTSKTVQLMQNADLQNKFIDDFKSMNKYLDAEGKKYSQKLTRKYNVNTYKNNWDEFEHYFEKVHIDFYEKLNIKFPNLTLNEKKLCAFLQLGMSTKDIALITFRTVGTINTARKRLRKKLNIPSEIKFQEYFSKLINS